MYLLPTLIQDIAPTNKYSDADLDEMIDNAHSYDGKPVDDHDRALIKQYLKALFSNK